MDNAPEWKEFFVEMITEHVRHLLRNRWSYHQVARLHGIRDRRRPFEADKDVLHVELVHEAQPLPARPAPPS